MKIVKAMLGGLALAATSFLAQADDMSYRYFQLGYVEIDDDDSSASADGFGTRGSFGFAENFFVFTEISKVEDSDFDADIDQYAIGLGGHYPLSDSVDLVGRIGWAKLKVESPLLGIDADEDGYLAGAGIRARAGDNFEFEVGVIHTDYGDIGDDTGGEVAARYYFTKRWAAALEYQDVGELSTVMAGVRYTFGQ